MNNVMIHERTRNWTNQGIVHNRSDLLDSRSQLLPQLLTLAYADDRWPGQD